MDAVVNNGRDKSLVHTGVSIGMHKALTAGTDLPEIENRSSGSGASGASVRTGGVTVGPESIPFHECHIEPWLEHIACKI